MSQTIENVVQLVSLQLGKKKISPEDRIVEDLGAESVDIVNIIAAVEDRFSVEIREEEIPEISTIIDLHRLIQQKQH